MPDIVQLEQMNLAANEAEDISTLADIGDIKLDGAAPLPQRFSQYMEQIRNPYCFRSGSIKIKVTYASGGKSLDEPLKNFFMGLKNC